MIPSSMLGARRFVLLRPFVFFFFLPLCASVFFGVVPPFLRRLALLRWQRSVVFHCRSAPCPHAGELLLSRVGPMILKAVLSMTESFGDQLL